MDWIDKALESVFGGAKTEAKAEAAPAPQQAPDEASRWFPDLSANNRRTGLRIMQAPNAKTPATAPTSSFDAVFNKLINAESGGKHLDASGKLLTSEAGAGGISQVMPKTALRPGYGVKPMQDKSEQEYLRFGKDLLKAYQKEFDGDIEKAVAAYNAGPGSVKKAIKAAAESGKEWWSHLPKKRETLPYMTKILGKDYAEIRRVQ